MSDQLYENVAADKGTQITLSSGEDFSMSTAVIGGILVIGIIVIILYLSRREGSISSFFGKSGGRVNGAK